MNVAGQEHARLRRERIGKENEFKKKRDECFREAEKKK